MTCCVRVIVVGAGSRGEIYSQFASIHPERMKVSAACIYQQGDSVIQSLLWIVFFIDCIDTIPVSQVIHDETLMKKTFRM